MVRRWYLCAGAFLTGAVLAPAAMGKEPSLAPASTLSTKAPAEPTPIEAAALSTSGEPSVVTAAKPAVVADKSDVEVVRERYPDGKIKVEREVIRDAEENYVNHGLWKMWD
ncbi:MAG: hypothetical protein K8T91_23290, partial [Planctomycetes bacterium]|nr:hypothetical protein [Planctomycetota bacterium]